MTKQQLELLLNTLLERGEFSEIYSYVTLTAGRVGTSQPSLHWITLTRDKFLFFPTWYELEVSDRLTTVNVTVPSHLVPLARRVFEASIERNNIKKGLDKTTLINKCLEATK